MTSNIGVKKVTGLWFSGIGFGRSQKMYLQLMKKTKNQFLTKELKELISLLSSINQYWMKLLSLTH